jgi:hypothetical protein
LIANTLALQPPEALSFASFFIMLHLPFYKNTELQHFNTLSFWKVVS